MQAAMYPDDDYDSSIHVGAFLNGMLIGAATFVQESHNSFSQAKTPFRLRGMATDTDFQGQGVGRQVLGFGTKELGRFQCDFLWCKAREIAFPFYERLDFMYFGELFDLPGIGLHKIMYKYL